MSNELGFLDWAEPNSRAMSVRTETDENVPECR